MVALMYLLRSPAPTISRSLYNPDDHYHVTLAVEHGMSAPTASHLAEVVYPGGLSHLRIGTQLTVLELLALLLETRKVVTL